MNNYAYHGSPDFNQWMDNKLQQFTKDTEALMGDQLAALILGGGYGRGEGGVEIIDGKEHPYNDLDFTLIVKDLNKVPHKELLELSARYARELGIHVDFSRPLSIDSIRNWPAWLMWYDLLNGHIVMSGPGDILTSNAPECVRSHPPQVEALRLLLNRGAGLLWALRVAREEESEPDRGFVIRNYFKMILSLGDALLLSRQRYATPYRGRDELLAQLCADDPSVQKMNLLEAYRSALTFKFSPHELADTPISVSTLEDAAVLWSEVLIETESLRTGKSWSDALSYAADSFIREPEMNGISQIPRNMARNLRCRRFSLSHPRERLYREITTLLLQPEEDWPQRSAAALTIWNQYN